MCVCAFLYLLHPEYQNSAFYWQSEDSSERYGHLGWSSKLHGVLALMLGFQVEVRVRGFVEMADVRVGGWGMDYE